MAQITYANKVALNENPEIALINKVTDDDLNEIKSVVNTNDDNVGDLTNLTTTTKTSIVAAVNELDSDKAEDDIILVQSTEPTSDTNILWIDDGQIGTPVSEITNSYSTSTGIGYSANYMNTYIDDTGWVDMSSYLNTTNFSVRSGYTPMARRIGKQVFWKGAVYCHTQVNDTQAILFANLPQQYCPTSGEMTGAGVHYGLGIPYKIWAEERTIRVNENSTNIPATLSYNGYSLSDVGTYLVD